MNVVSCGGCSSPPSTRRKAMQNEINPAKYTKSIQYPYKNGRENSLPLCFDWMFCGFALV
jgi:hypothetical protein